MTLGHYAGRAIAQAARENAASHRQRAQASGQRRGESNAAYLARRRGVGTLAERAQRAQQSAATLKTLQAAVGAAVQTSGVSPAAIADRRAGAAVAVREAEPAAVAEVVYDSAPPEPIDGAELLGHLAGYFGNYIAFPSTAPHVTVTLWNGAAAARDRDDSGIGPLIWRALALLGVTSSENKSGKSTVLDLSRFVHGVNRPVKVTGRSMAHKLGRKHEPVMLDEAKVTFGAGAASRDVQAVMLAAYSKGGTWDYSRGNSDMTIPCFGPIAYAAKDELLTATGEQLVDIFDRTIFIRMRRPKALMPQHDELAEDDGAMLGQALADWTSSVKGPLKARAKELARLDQEASQAAAQDGREIDARTPQIWRPLLAVADIAGGPWPALARQAMRELTDGAPALEAAGKLAAVRDRAERWTKPAFLTGDATPDLDDDTDDYEED